MADTLSNNFCSLCGRSFDRTGSDNTNIRTSLASPVVEESGLLEMLDITVSPLRKELVFICYSCKMVFSNYTMAKSAFKEKEKEALKLLTEPVERNEQGQLPFVPYLKRKFMHRPNSEIPVARPTKYQKVENAASVANSATLPQRPGGTGGTGGTGEPVNHSKDPHSQNHNHARRGDGSASYKVKNFRSEVVKLLEQGFYRSAIRKLWKNSKKFRGSLLTFLSVIIKNEMKSLLKHETLFTKKMTDAANVNDISWEPTMSVVSQVATTTLHVLYALLGHHLGKGSSEAQAAKQSFIGILLSMALYKRYKGRANFLPLLHSLYLHNNGTSLKVNRTLHEIGLTTPPCKLFEVLRQRSSMPSDPVRDWKEEVEHALKIVHHRPTPAPRKYNAERRKSRSVLPKPTTVISYGLCWDSIQHPQYSSHSQKRNPDPLMAQAYAARNRVPFLMTYKDQDIRLADNISFEEFVPDSEDFIRVREQMKKEVQKILIKYLKVFNKLTVTEHHHYSDLMMQKNYMVDLGSVFKSPTDNGNVALILKDLKAYMPCDEGEATPLCVFGNKRSVERMVCAKDVMSCFSEKEDRLDGLEPCVTDYGRQILLAQDIIKIFYPSDLANESGSLHHICTNFKPGVTRSENLDFKTISSLLELVAHGHTMAMAEQKLHLMTSDGNNLSTEERKRILEKISEEIVNEIWPKIDTASLDVVRQSSEPVRDGECSFGDCVNFKDKALLPCSERCSRPFYFCCKKPLNDGLVECSRRENCPRGAWFHLNKKCSGLSEAPEDDWLCSSCSTNIDKLRQVEQVDRVWEYHRGLLWYSLFFWVANSAERQGNGWLLHAVWKVCMPIFENHGQTEFLHLGYSFLSAVAGRISRMASHDAVHNRTVNLKGGPNNMSWDRAIEIFNQEFLRKPEDKASVSTRASSCWTRSVNAAWEKNICNKPDMRERDLSRQVEDYVTLVNSLKILEKVPGRQWYKDIEFAHNLFVKEPENFIKTLKIFCDKDVARQMNERETESEVLE
ncbi:uncharacterized protein LOC122264540 isoform X2 [Penaeus japonicus]|uniref:uncharacterized protein LOC122264540 isoform X2 n=1 Tax=Penaeus japonicus TaxID=27405 RepID=UPI001C70B914|nr:uncharacterized protein LOC122264540 isoform X2 [Penaeus japonicus]